jgi:hypothetical protein
VALFLAGALFLSGCAPVALLQTREERADTVAREAGWIREKLTAGRFTLRAYRPRIVANDGTLAVYIEGDGVPWETPTVRSFDPTPDNTITLQLALQDPTPNRLYLARPCQFLAPRELAACNPAYWTSHRYAPEIVAALNDAIEQEKHRTQTRNITLFGYSGGGALAILVAASRRDVSRIVTIAGNLDDAAWTRLHRVAPLIGSMNPAKSADGVSHIRQIHFVGREDKIIPLAIAASYRGQVKDQSNILVIEVPGADHTCCWVEKWPSLLRAYIYPGSGESPT